MKYIDDAEKRIERHKAFWEGEVIDRPVVTILGMNNNAIVHPGFSMLPPASSEMFKWYTDAEWRLKNFRLACDNSTWVGDRLPMVFLNLGAAGHAGFFKGMKNVFSDAGLIFENELDEDNPSLEFDENSIWYKKTLEMAQYLVDESNGDYLVSQSDCCGNADVLAAVKGTDSLLMDMILGADYIKPAMDKIQKAYERIHKEVYDIVRDNNNGASGIGWLHTYAPGLSAQIQSDICCMISPELFEKYIVPELEAQCEMLDYPLYHLDGQEVVRHLDHLLSVEKLKAIQWTRVDGQPSPVEFIDVMKKIQAAGKSLLVLFDTIEEVDILTQNLSSKGLHLHTNFAAMSDDDANEIIKVVERNTHD